MGWTSIHATHYKNGKIDKKAECDSYFMEGLNRGYYHILKSSIVGNVYYAAVKPLKQYNKDDNGNEIIIDIPESSQKVFGAVFLISIDNNDYFNFSYKTMDESYGPCYYDCPKRILDLLTPTDNEYANIWRKKCCEQLEKKKNPNSLNKLPVNTVIQVTMPFDIKYFKKGDIVKLQKRKNWNSNRTSWYVIKFNIRFTSGLMKSLEPYCKIIEKGEIPY